MFQHHYPVGRARHGKRLPQILDEDGNIPSPITLTVTEIRQPASSSPVIPVITPTVTVFVPPAGPTSSSSPLPPSSPPVPDPTSTLSPGTGVTSSISRPTPSVSVVNNDDVNTNTVEASSAASSQGVSTGSIVGIVLAIALLVTAAAIFWFRRRAIANRLKLRGWTNKPNKAPSFLWIEPKGGKGITPYPNMSSTTPFNGATSASTTYSGGQPPSLAFMPSSNGLPYIPPPPPPRPPPAAGMYDNPPTPVSVAAAVPPAMTTSGAGSARLPTPAAATASLPVESARVRSTFIPTLPDELSINTGEMVRIHAEYDDGWALCSNVRGAIGMAPLECLDRGTLSPNGVREFKKLARYSSLAAKSYGAYQ
ncbi:hypothetical protein D9615_001569 [Tricholomella constricta]|uniref:SH3 domain-containing protein n=1 Tax=Tricholomella constricta TaxID=117010 RepID=A0A8H5HNL5_9AGAR|nr:hypothetical protein D9615_001569 [Tricholomella constricta]